MQKILVCFLKKNGLELAPFYDLMCTRIYEGLSDKLAMRVGGENRIDRLQVRHLERFSDEINVKPALIFKRLENIKNKIIPESKNLSLKHQNSDILNKINNFIENVSKKF